MNSPPTVPTIPGKTFMVEREFMLSWVDNHPLTFATSFNEFVRKYSDDYTIQVVARQGYLTLIATLKN